MKVSSALDHRMVPSWYIMLAAFVCVSALGAFMARILAGDQYRFSHNGSIHLGMLRPKPAVNDFADTHHAVHQRWTAPTVMVSRQAVLAAVAAAAAAVMSCMRAVRAVEAAGKDDDIDRGMNHDRVYDGAFAVGYAYLFTLILHTFTRVEGRQRRNFISSIIRAAGLTAILISVILWQRAFEGGDSSMAWGRHGGAAGSRRDGREHDETDVETAIEREDLAWSVDGEEELDGLVFRIRNPSFRDDSLFHRGWAVAAFALGSALFTLSLCASTENLKRCADRAETSAAATRELLSMHDENARMDATEAEVSLYWTFSSEHYAIVCAADVALVFACVTASLIIDLTCDAVSDSSSGSRADGDEGSRVAGALPIVLLAIVWWFRYLNVWARASFDSRKRSMYTRTLLVYNFISVSLLCCIAAFVALIAHGLIRTSRRIEVIGVMLAAALTVLSVSALCQPPWPTPLVVQMRRSTAHSHTKDLLGIDVLTCTDAVTMHSTVAATLSAQGLSAPPYPFSFS